MRLLGRNVAMELFVVAASCFIAATSNYTTDYSNSFDDSIPYSSSAATMDQPEPNAAAGVLNFRASSLPAELKNVGGSSSEDYIISLDMLMPNAPRSYDIKVHQEGNNHINSDFVSKTDPAVVKETDISLQFNSKKLYSLVIEVEFEVDEEPSPPAEPQKYSVAGSPTLSHTVMPEEASYYGSRFENYSAAPTDQAKADSALVLHPVGRTGTTGGLFRQEK